MRSVADRPDADRERVARADDFTRADMYPGPGGQYGSKTYMDPVGQHASVMHNPGSIDPDHFRGSMTAAASQAYMNIKPGRWPVIMPGGVPGNPYFTSSIPRGTDMGERGGSGGSDPESDKERLKAQKMINDRMVKLQMSEPVPMTDPIKINTRMVRMILKLLQQNPLAWSALNTLLDCFFEDGFRFRHPKYTLLETYQQLLIQNWEPFFREHALQAYCFGITLVRILPNDYIIGVPHVGLFELNDVYFWIDQHDKYHYRVYRDGLPLPDMFVIPYFKPTPSGEIDSPFSKLLVDAQFKKTLRDAYVFATNEQAMPTIALEENLQRVAPQRQETKGPASGGVAGRLDQRRNNMPGPVRQAYINALASGQPDAAVQMRPAAVIGSQIQAGARSAMPIAGSGGVPDVGNGGGGGGPGFDSATELLNHWLQKHLSVQTKAGEIGWAAGKSAFQNEIDIASAMSKAVNSERGPKSSERMTQLLNMAQHPMFRSHNVEAIPQLGRKVLKAYNGYKVHTMGDARAPDHFVHLDQEFERHIRRVFALDAALWGDHTLNHKPDYFMSRRKLKGPGNHIMRKLQSTGNTLLYEIFGVWEAYHTAKEYAIATEREKKKMKLYAEQQKRIENMVASWAAPTVEVVGSDGNKVTLAAVGSDGQLTVVPEKSDEPHAHLMMIRVEFGWNIRHNKDKAFLTGELDENDFDSDEEMDAVDGERRRNAKLSAKRRDPFSSSGAGPMETGGGGGGGGGDPRRKGLGGSIQRQRLHQDHMSKRGMHPQSAQPVPSPTTSFASSSATGVRAPPQQRPPSSAAGATSSSRPPSGGDGGGGAPADGQGGEPVTRDEQVEALVRQVQTLTSMLEKEKLKKKRDKERKKRVDIWDPDADEKNNGDSSSSDESDDESDESDDDDDDSASKRKKRKKNKQKGRKGRKGKKRAKKDRKHRPTKAERIKARAEAEAAGMRAPAHIPSSNIEFPQMTTHGVPPPSTLMHHAPTTTEPVMPDLLSRVGNFFDRVIVEPEGAEVRPDPPAMLIVRDPRTDSITEMKAQPVQAAPDAEAGGAGGQPGGDGGGGSAGGQDGGDGGGGRPPANGASATGAAGASATADPIKMRALNIIGRSLGAAIRTLPAVIQGQVAEVGGGGGGGGGDAAVAVRKPKSRKPQADVVLNGDDDNQPGVVVRGRDKVRDGDGGGGSSSSGGGGGSNGNGGRRDKDDDDSDKESGKRQGQRPGKSPRKATIRLTSGKRV